MTNEFKVTVGANTIILKIVRFILILSVGYAFVAYFKHYPMIRIYLMVASGLLCEILLTVIKSYTVIGKITFYKANILIDTYNLKIDVPYTTIIKIVFKIKGYKRVSYRPSLLQPIGVNRPNETGNLMVIETNGRMYELNILLLNAFDARALDYQISKLKDSGLKIETVIMPGITVDSI